MGNEERKEAVSLALQVLKKTLIETNTSIAFCDKQLVFFGTEDYQQAGGLKDIPKFGVKLTDLVKS